MYGIQLYVTLPTHNKGQGTTVVAGGTRQCELWCCWYFGVGLPEKKLFLVLRSIYSRVQSIKCMHTWEFSLKIFYLANFYFVVCSLQRASRSEPQSTCTTSRYKTNFFVTTNDFTYYSRNRRILKWIPTVPTHWHG